MTYYKYLGTGCSGAQTDVGSVGVRNTGTVPPSPNLSFQTPGTYYFTASFSGFGSFPPMDSPCEMLTVTGTITSVTTAGSTTAAAVTTGASLFSNLLTYVVILVILAGLLGTLFFLRGRRSGSGGKKKPPPPPLTGGPPPPPPPPPPTTPEVVTCCGPDVTENVLGAMLRLMNDFFSWTPDEQKRQIGYLTRLPRPWADDEPNSENAWDIAELGPSEARGGPPVSYQTAGHGYKATLRPYVGRCMKPDPPCDPSVIFLGNCHHPQVVNYIEWGILARLSVWLSGSSATSYQDSSYYSLHAIRSGPVTAPVNTMPSPEA